MPKKKNKMPKPLIESEAFKLLSGDNPMAITMLENQAKEMKKKKYKKAKMPKLKLDYMSKGNPFIDASSSGLHTISKAEMKEMKRKSKEPCEARELSLTTLHKDGDYATIHNVEGYYGDYITIAKKNGKTYIFFDNPDIIKFIECKEPNDKQWKKYFKE